MLGNFSYSNPTKLYFGEDSLQFLNEELPKYGKNILLTYGGGSIKTNGIYDKVVAILKAIAKTVDRGRGRHAQSYRAKTLRRLQTGKGAQGGPNPCRGRRFCM